MSSAIRKFAGALLRRLQSLRFYRLLGRGRLAGLLVREVVPADYPALQRLLGGPDPSAGQSAPRHSNPQVTEWVAEYGGQLIGFVQLVRRPSAELYGGHWLFSLIVASRWRGLGVGERLSQAVIDRSRQEGAPRLDLVVYAHNLRAVRLYEKLGFVQYTHPLLEAQLAGELAAAGRRRVVMGLSLE